MNVRTLAELARLSGAELVGDGALEVSGPARLDTAGPGEISFLSHPRYREQLQSTRAGAVVVARDEPVERADVSLLRCDDPEAAFNQIVLAFAPPVPSLPREVHPTAVVHPSASIGADVAIGPFCVVDAEAVLGDGVSLHERVSIGASARVGARSELHANVILYPYSVLGADCIVHGGAVIGSDGFGFRRTTEGWVKTPQVGNVVVGDRVEIGANAAIDCGRFGSTRIGSGSKIDNLVHVAHNVDVGADCLLIAQAGIAGSTRLGAGVIVAGQAGVSGHLEVGAGARIGGGAGLIHSVPPNTDWFGYPAKPRLTTLRIAKDVERLPELRRRLRDLEKRMAELDGGEVSEVGDEARGAG